MLNLFGGIGLKLFGDYADWFFTISFHLFGYALALSVSVFLVLAISAIVAGLRRIKAMVAQLYES